MRCLIVGGTRFVGRHLAQIAHAKGWDVTLFHRGKHPSPLGEQVQTILGDRHHDLLDLTENTWDVVIDTCGYFPSSVKMLLDALQEMPQTPHYTFISTISVYEDFAPVDLCEADVPPSLDASKQALLQRLDQARDLKDEAFGPMYGAMKYACEQEIVNRASFGPSALIIRPGLVVGPWDYTDRLTYWPDRFAQGGRVLVPKHMSQPIQWIDVRDLAQWTIDMVERKASGVYNATSPAGQWTMQQLIDACKANSPADTEVVEVDEAFLLAQEVQPWSQLPLWLPESLEATAGLMQINTQLAHDEGLRCRPVAQTISELQQWSQDNAERTRENPALLTLEREQALLEMWDTRD